MKTWWLAVKTEHCSYLELKHRKVVAQGWHHLGNIISLKKFFPDNNKEFVQVIQLLGDVECKDEGWWHDDREPSRCPAVIWNLMDVKRGDLIVGIEGTRVMGICEMHSDGNASYRYDGDYEYAQTIGFPVEWVDWESSIFGFTPTAPQHSVLGIRKLNNDNQAVVDAWQKYKSRC